jgi:hypothetical protein
MCKYVFLLTRIGSGGGDGGRRKQLYDLKESTQDSNVQCQHQLYVGNGLPLLEVAVLRCKGNLLRIQSSQ